MGSTGRGKKRDSNKSNPNLNCQYQTLQKSTGSTGLSRETFWAKLTLTVPFPRQVSSVIKRKYLQNLDEKNPWSEKFWSFSAPRRSLEHCKPRRHCKYLPFRSSSNAARTVGCRYLAHGDGASQTTQLSVTSINSLLLQLLLLLLGN